VISSGAVFMHHFELLLSFIPWASRHGILSVYANWSRSAGGHRIWHLYGFKPWKHLVQSLSPGVHGPSKRGWGFYFVLPPVRIYLMPINFAGETSWPNVPQNWFCSFAFLVCTLWLSAWLVRAQWVALGKVCYACECMEPRLVPFICS
jgi:hypothetical protein